LFERIYLNITLSFLVKMEDNQVINRHLVTGSKVVTTVTLEVLVNGQRKQIASSGDSPINALHNVLLNAFGYKVGSWWVEQPSKDKTGTLYSTAFVDITGNGRRYVGGSDFIWDPELSHLFDATIKAYLEALEHSKQQLTLTSS